MSDPIVKEYNENILNCTEENTTNTKCVGTGMGGHEGALVDLLLENATEGKCYYECGKKINTGSTEEFDFYKSYNSAMKTNPDQLPPHIRAFQKYIPSVDTEQIYNIQDKTYFMLENLNRLVDDDNPERMDCKIGAKTAFKADKGFFGHAKHKILDDIESRSTENKIRLEGLTPIHVAEQMLADAKQNPDESGWQDTHLQHHGKKQVQSGLYTLHPHFFLKKFITNPTHALKLKTELTQMLFNFIIPNYVAASQKLLDNTAQSIGFIGSSILIVKGKGGIIFKLIDFAHAFWNNPLASQEMTPKKHKQIVENYCEGLTYFILQYYLFYEYTFGSTQQAMPQSMPQAIQPATQPAIHVYGGRHKKTKHKKQKTKYKKQTTKQKKSQTKNYIPQKPT
jgi:hypothetical protein